MHPTSEVPFRDARFALVAVFLPVALVVSVLRPGRGPSGAAKTGSIVELRQFWLHGLFFIASYAIWLKQFGYQRYALPLELLTGLMLFLSLDRLLRNRKKSHLRVHHARRVYRDLDSARQLGANPVRQATGSASRYHETRNPKRYT